MLRPEEESDWDNAITGPCPQPQPIHFPSHRELWLYIAIQQSAPSTTSSTSPYVPATVVGQSPLIDGWLWASSTTAAAYLCTWVKVIFEPIPGFAHILQQISDLGRPQDPSEHASTSSVLSRLNETIIVLMRRSKHSAMPSKTLTGTAAQGTVAPTRLGLTGTLLDSHQSSLFRALHQDLKSWHSKNWDCP